MINFHGANKTHSYFEGWYFKHQGKAHTVSFIPGVNFDMKGKKSAFVQVITDTASFYLEYPYLCFHASDHKMSLQIENNKFSDSGIEINIQTSAIHCTGTIKYESLLSPESDIMGPFRFFPLMECKHGIISMGHSLKGSLLLNNEKIDFDGGIGYIEKDWGTSFPKNYLWVQCNDFGGVPCSVMVSIAKVPFCGRCFNGCICIVNYNGAEYRLATYKGVQIIRYDETGFVLKQGEYVFTADILSQNSQSLVAPQSGSMLRTIHESASGCARFHLYKQNKLLFDLQSNHAGFEFVK